MDWPTSSQGCYLFHCFLFVCLFFFVGHQYGKKDAGDVGHIPPGWDQWHALVSHTHTHTNANTQMPYLPVLLLLQPLLCVYRWATRSTTTTRCQSTAKKRRTVTVMKRITLQTSSWVVITLMTAVTPACSKPVISGVVMHKDIYVGIYGKKCDCSPSTCLNQLMS